MLTQSMVLLIEKAIWQSCKNAKWPCDANYSCVGMGCEVPALAYMLLPQTVLTHTLQA